MRKLRTLRALLVLGALGLAASGLAGCGSTGSPRSGRHRLVLVAPARGGAQVFSSECQVCHSLVGNESRHTQGGDLLGFRFSRATLTQFTREMPVKHRLSAEQLGAVVDYVLRVQRLSRRG